MAENDLAAVILSGGSGTRFWPLSRKHLPKQYLTLFGGRSLVQDTFDRLAGAVDPKNIYTISTRLQKPLLEAQLPEVDHHLFEPEGRNTGPCLMLTAIELMKQGRPPGTVLAVLPADHYIVDKEAFRQALKKAADYARREDALVTFGITPSHPHTGYGYIESGESVGGGVHRVKRFVEKPDRTKAETFLAAGTFHWNSGMFVWKLGTLVAAFEDHAAAAWNAILSASDREKAYYELKAEPIDTMILEKAKNVFVVPARMGWSDVGSWSALFDLKPKDGQENCVLGGRAVALESRRCLVAAPKDRTVALVGVEDLIVIESDGYVLVCRRDKDQLVREAAKLLDP